MAITKQFEKLMVPPSDELSAPSVPSSWSSKSPSVPDSASQQMAAELSVRKAQQLNEVNAKLEKYRKRLEALESERKGPQKRDRNDADVEAAKGQTGAAAAGPDDRPPPTKKPSPEVPPVKNKTKPKRRPKKDVPAPLEAEMAPPSPDHDSESSDKETQPYDGLNSIVCACKQEGGFTPGKDGLTFEFCVELVEEEILAAAEWDREQKTQYLPMIISALKFLYPSIEGSWDNKVFSKSPSGAARYWIKVLKSWKLRWEDKAEDEKQPHKSPPATMASVTSRIRNKIANNFRSKARQLFSEKVNKKTNQQEPIVISDSDSDGPIAASAAAASSSKPAAKLAPPT